MTHPAESLWSEIGAAVAGFVTAAAGALGIHRRKSRQECRFNTEALTKSSREDTDRIVEAIRQQGTDTRKAIYEGLHDVSEKQGAMAVEVAVVKEMIRKDGGRG